MNVRSLARRVGSLHPAIQAIAAVAVIAALIAVIWPAPPGVIAQGVIIGALTSLISLGITLIYRANRVVSFAQGDLGAAPASLVVLLMAHNGLNWFLALGLGAVVAVVVGAGVELIVVRRFTRSPRLILAVATIGLTQILAAAGLALPIAFGDQVPPERTTAPFDWSITIRPITFHGADIIAVATVPLVLIGLAYFLRRTLTGRAIRAVAEDRDRAALLGIPVGRINTTVWALAAALSFLAMFLRAGVVGLPIGQVLGPSILLRALAAAVIGRFERLGVVVAAAITLGVLENAIYWNAKRLTVVDPILFVIVLAALLFVRRAPGRRVDDEQLSSWQAGQAERPLPAAWAALPQVRIARLLGSVVAVVTIIGLPALLGEREINLAAVIVIFSLVGLSLVVLTGWAGQVSLGQMAFVAIGAGVAGHLAQRGLGLSLFSRQPFAGSWDLTAATLAAGCVGAFAAVMIGLPALRVRGMQLAVVTLALALAVSSWLLNPAELSWMPRERQARKPLLGEIALTSETSMYYVSIVVVALCTLLVIGWRRGRSARILIAVRENEKAASSYGLSPTRAKLTGFALSGFLAAVAGALFFFHQQELSQSLFKPEQSLSAFATVVIGGLGSIPGAFIGAAYVRGLEYYVPSAAWRLFATGAGMLVILMVLPQGLGGALVRVRDLVVTRVLVRPRGPVDPAAHVSPGEPR